MLNYSENAAPPAASPAVAHYTVAGVFEDRIDARQVLDALMRTSARPEDISIAFRESETTNGARTKRSGEVARAVTEAELNDISNRLVGLVSVVVPDRGRFLVAGPVGAVLAGITFDEDWDDLAGQLPADPDPSALFTVLATFGFNQDEALYIEHRLVAGAELIAVMTNNPELVPVLRRVLADGNAVYITSARTDEQVLREAARLLESPPEVYEQSDIVISDAVAQLRPILADNPVATWASAFRGMLVVDPQGIEAGTIEELLVGGDEDEEAEPIPDNIRYVVIGFGGLLGIGRRYTVVPVDRITLGANQARVTVARDILQQAPPYDASAPLSRREEHAICAYFDTTPYWVSEGEEV